MDLSLLPMAIIYILDDWVKIDNVSRVLIDLIE